MTQQNDPPQDPTVPYQGSAFVDRDQEHLKVLSICWYVFGGMAGLFGFFPLIYVFLGIVFIVSPASMAGSGAPPPAAMGWMFAIMGSCGSLFIWTAAILGLLTGRSLSQRRRITLCYITAALACLQVPVGTVLGIFTFIILGRPAIKASFR